MIKVVNGDLLKASEDIIAHQCNAQGVMGSGVAKMIRKQYPKVYDDYVLFCKEQSPFNLMGKCQIVNCGDKIVANLIGQLNYGRMNVRYTDYDALRNALVKLKRFAEDHALTVALPYNVGCGLANGEWSVVEKIIEDVFGSYGVTLYRL